MLADEQFEAGGEELRRHFSMDGGVEPEKLRAAPSAEAQGQGPDPLFTGDSGYGDDMISTGIDVVHHAASMQVQASWCPTLRMWESLLEHKLVNSS